MGCILLSSVFLSGYNVSMYLVIALEEECFLLTKGLSVLRTGGSVGLLGSMCCDIDPPIYVGLFWFRWPFLNSLTYFMLRLLHGKPHVAGDK